MADPEIDRVTDLWQKQDQERAVGRRGFSLVLLKNLENRNKLQTIGLTIITINSGNSLVSGCPQDQQC